MTYTEYFKLREHLKKELEKMYKQRNAMETCYEKTQMNSVKVEIAHLTNIIENIEEAVNGLDYFVYYD